MAEYQMRRVREMISATFISVGFQVENTLFPVAHPHFGLGILRDLEERQRKNQNDSGAMVVQVEGNIFVTG